MKKLTKLASLLLVSLMLFSLAACGSNTSSAAKSDGNTASKTDGSSAAESKVSGDVVTIKWIAVGNGMPDNYDSWAKQLNEYLAEKIGVNIDMEIVPWGDWDTRRNVIVNTGTDYDILFTNQNNYNNDVKIGAFADLTDMLSKVPELQSMIPADYWDACRVNDKIYAVPTYKDSSQSEFIVWDAELAKKLDIDIKSIDTLEKMNPALEKIKDDTGKPSYIQYQTASPWLTFEYDNMNSGLPALGVRYDDESGKVVYTYEQDDIMSYLKLYHQWYKAGIINSDAATKPEQKEYRPCFMAQGWSGAAKTTWGPEVDMTAEAYQWGPTIVSNDTVRGSLNCISANSKNPEKALEFLQLINTDPYVRDSFFYGEKGVDWDYADDGRVHRNRTDWEMAGYTQASFFTVTQTDEIDFNQWDEVLELNKHAKPSVLIGFTFDTSSIDDQLVNCREIMERYKGELLTGTADPEVAVPAMLKELKDAGFDEITAEAQKQVNEFLAA